MLNEDTNNMPPPPPSPYEEVNSLDPEVETQIQNYEQESNNFIPGEFLYIKDEWNREMLVNAWNAITQTNMWDYMKKEIYSYSWSDDKEVDLIYKKIEELGYDGHSGCSFGWTMRQMQYIAQHGEENYMKIIISDNSI
jgi:hypothetical protein